MKKTDYASVVPMIKVWESKLLNNSFYEKLIDTSSLEDCVKVLQETPYGGYIKLDNIESSLEEMYLKEYTALKSMVQCEGILSMMSLKYDYHNIKTLIKSQILNKDFSYILSPCGMIDKNFLSKCIKDNELKELDSLYREAIEDAYCLYEKFKDFQEIDIALDKRMFNHMKVYLKKIDSEFVEEYLIALIDLTNIKTSLRISKMKGNKTFLKKVLLEGGSIEPSIYEAILSDGINDITSKLLHTKYSEVINKNITSLSEIEILIDDYITNKIKAAKLIGLGVEPVFAYLYAKEIELKNLRIILTGKLNCVDKKLILERVRDSYV